MFRRAAGLATAVSVAAVGGCSDGSDDAGASSFVGQLGLIPASVADLSDADSGLTVVMSDLDRAAELAGVERPDDPSDREAVIDYLNSITGISVSDEDPSPVAALLPEASQHQTAATQLDQFVDEVGWSLLDVSWSVEYVLPPSMFTVMGGDFDEDQLTEAIGEPQDDIWRIGNESEDDGVPLDPAERTVARPLGEPLRLALDDDKLVVGRVTSPVEDALEGSDGTLADSPVLRSLAGALDDEDVYSAMLMTGRSFELVSFIPDATPEVVAAAEDEALPEEFDGVALGLAYEDNQAVAVFAYTHADEEAAATNADALERLVDEGVSVQTRQPWSELFTVEEVRTKDNVLVARLGIPADRPAAQAYSLLSRGDSLVTHS